MSRALANCARLWLVGRQGSHPCAVKNSTNTNLPTIESAAESAAAGAGLAPKVIAHIAAATQRADARQAR
jgi:hypothetical protein